MSLRGGGGGFPLQFDKYPYSGEIIGAIGARGLSGLAGGTGGYPLDFGGRFSNTEAVREIAQREYLPYGAQLGCCDDQWGHMGELFGLGTCPGPTVVVEDNPIPMWVWLAVGIWGVLMLVKKR